MKVLLFLLTVTASLLAQVSWTTVPPRILSSPAPKLIFSEAGYNLSSIVVTVRFTDNSTPANTRDKEYLVRGENARNDLARLVWEDLQTLQNSTAVVPGNITPWVPPTPFEQALQDYQTASLRIDSLDRLKARLGLQETDTIGTSGLTVAQVRTTLRNALKADLTSANRITAALDATR